MGQTLIQRFLFSSIFALVRLNIGNLCAHASLWYSLLTIVFFYQWSNEKIRRETSEDRWMGVSQRKCHIWRNQWKTCRVQDGENQVSMRCSIVELTKCLFLPFACKVLRPPYLQAGECLNCLINRRQCSLLTASAMDTGWPNKNGATLFRCKYFHNPWVKCAWNLVRLCRIIFRMPQLEFCFTISTFSGAI